MPEETQNCLLRSQTPNWCRAWPEPSPELPQPDLKDQESDGPGGRATVLSSASVILSSPLAAYFTKEPDRRLLHTLALLKPACLSNRQGLTMCAEQSHNPWFPLETRLKIGDMQQRSRQEGRNGSINSPSLLLIDVSQQMPSNLWKLSKDALIYQNFLELQ